MKRYIFTIAALVALATLCVFAIAMADMSVPKEFQMSGVDLATPIGNATGSTGAKDVRESNSYQLPGAVSCMYGLTNASGVIVANTATFDLRASMDGVNYTTVQTVPVAASTYGWIYNAAIPQARYWDINLTAVQNANGWLKSNCIWQ